MTTLLCGENPRAVRSDSKSDTQPLRFRIAYYFIVVKTGPCSPSSHRTALCSLDSKIAMPSAPARHGPPSDQTLAQLLVLPQEITDQIFFYLLENDPFHFGYRSHLRDLKKLRRVSRSFELGTFSYFANEAEHHTFVFYYDNGGLETLADLAHSRLASSVRKLWLASKDKTAPPPEDFLEQLADSHIHIHNLQDIRLDNVAESCSSSTTWLQHHLTKVTRFQIQVHLKTVAKTIANDRCASWVPLISSLKDAPGLGFFHLTLRRPNLEYEWSFTPRIVLDDSCESKAREFLEVLIAYASIEEEPYGQITLTAE